MLVSETHSRRYPVESALPGPVQALTTTTRVYRDRASATTVTESESPGGLRVRETAVSGLLTTLTESILTDQGEEQACCEQQFTYDALVAASLSPTRALEKAESSMTPRPARHRPDRPPRASHHLRIPPRRARESRQTRRPH